MSLLELTASVCGLASVYFTVQRHILCWPTGLVMVVLYLVIFYQVKLYSDMLLQVVYVILQVYGWHAWLYGGPDRSPLVVSRVSPLRSLIVLAGGLLIAFVWGTLMRTFTDASFPYLDAVAAVASLIAQWWMARKVLESWLVWIFVDAFSIGLYLGKSLYLTAGLYAVFLGLAIWGWREWRRVWSVQATV